METLAGKTMLVTGGAQGIGAEIALGAAAAGANVVIVDVLSGDTTVQRVIEQSGQALAVEADITDDQSLGRAIEQAQQQFGEIDVLVNNAAMFGDLQQVSLEDISYEVWDQVMRVNVRGPLQCVRAVLPGMQRLGRGSIINITTNRIYRGFANMLHYDASKGALSAMTRSMAAELGDRHIRVNAIAPGLTMSDRVLAKEGIQGRNAQIVKARALGRSQEPQDLVGAVVFLASDASGFISGQTLVVDGGGVML
ncbi:MAG: glucose 1-dehydrogenase [Pseudomonadota bacterium]